MRRHISNFTAAASLLLCTATVVFWVRSYWVLDVPFISWPRPATRSIYFIRIFSNRGCLMGQCFGFTFNDRQFAAEAANAPRREWTMLPAGTGYYWEIGTVRSAGEPLGFWRSLGFAYVNSDQHPEFIGRQLYLPHWIVSLTFAILPMLWLARHRRSGAIGPAQAVVERSGEGVKRKLLDFAAAMSLLLCAVTVVAWSGSVFVRCSAEFNGISRPFRFTKVDLCFLVVLLALAVLPMIAVARSLTSSRRRG